MEEKIYMMLEDEDNCEEVKKAIEDIEGTLNYLAQQQDDIKSLKDKNCNEEDKTITTDSVTSKDGRVIKYRRYRNWKYCSDTAGKLIIEKMQENMLETLSEEVVKQGLSKEIVGKIDKINIASKFISAIYDPELLKYCNITVTDEVKNYAEQKLNKEEDNILTESDVESFDTVNQLILKIREKYQKILDPGKGVAFVDGSVDFVNKMKTGQDKSNLDDKDIFGCGVVIIYKRSEDKDIVIEMLHEGITRTDTKNKSKDYSSGSQIGEQGATILAIKYAAQLGLSDITIVFDSKPLKYAFYGKSEKNENGRAEITKFLTQYIYYMRTEKNMKIHCQDVLIKTHTALTFKPGTSKDEKAKLKKIFTNKWGDPGNVLADGLATLGTHEVAVKQRKDVNGNDIKRKTLEECLKKGDASPFLE